MASIHTYYPQEFYDNMVEASRKLLDKDPKRMDKFIKACLKYGMDHLEEIKKVLEQ